MKDRTSAQIQRDAIRNTAIAIAIPAAAWVLDWLVKGWAQ